MERGSCSYTASKKFNEMTSSSSEDDDSSHALRRLRRDAAQGTFAHALTSSRQQSGYSSNFDSNGNPKYGNEMLLYSKTGYHLKITLDGRVSGTLEEDDPYSILEIVSADIPGHVMIRGKKSQLYVAMNKNGRLYGEADKRKEQTKWLEEFLGSYNTYMSRSYAHLGWFLGIKRSGKPKRGQKTGWGQKATQFLPRRLK